MVEPLKRERCPLCGSDLLKEKSGTYVFDWPEGRTGTSVFGSVMNMGLDERRAWFVYEAARLAAEAAGAPIVPVPWSDREREFRDQFVGVIKRQCGESRSRSAAELHGGWMQTYFDMGLAYGEKYDREKKTHPDLVPYAELDQKERDKDEVFIALCEIARRWIGGGAG